MAHFVKIDGRQIEDVIKTTKDKLRGHRAKLYSIIVSKYLMQPDYYQNQFTKQYREHIKNCRMIVNTFFDLLFRETWSMNEIATFNRLECQRYQVAICEILEAKLNAANAQYQVTSQIMRSIVGLLDEYNKNINSEYQTCWTQMSSLTQFCADSKGKLSYNQ